MYILRRRHDCLGIDASRPFWTRRDESDSLLFPLLTYQIAIVFKIENQMRARVEGNGDGNCFPQARRSEANKAQTCMFVFESLLFRLLSLVLGWFSSSSLALSATFSRSLCSSLSPYLLHSAPSPPPSVSLRLADWEIVREKREAERRERQSKGWLT